MDERASVRVEIDRVRVRAGVEDVSPERLERELARELSRRLRSHLERSRRASPGGGRAGDGGRRDGVGHGGEGLAASAAREIADEVVDRMSRRRG